MAWTISTMAWTILDGSQLLQQQQFDGSNNLNWGIKTLEHGLSFLLECAYDNGEFVYQVRQPNGDLQLHTMHIMHNVNASHSAYTAPVFMLNFSKGYLEYFEEDLGLLGPLNQRSKPRQMLF
jgi:hypothetical protein